MEGGQLKEDQLISSSPMYEATVLQRETAEIAQELERVLVRLQPLVQRQIPFNQDVSKGSEIAG